MIPYGLLIRVGVALALAAAAWWAWHAFTDHYREQGRVEVRAEWEQDKARRIKAVTDQTMLWDAQRQKTERAEHERDQARQAAAEAVKQRAASLPVDVARAPVPGAFVGVLRAGRDSANAAGAAAEPHQAAAGSASGADESSTLGAIAEWVAEVTDILAECRDRVAGWATFYGGLRAAQLKE